jgi:hypothetical protein
MQRKQKELKGVKRIADFSKHMASLLDSSASFSYSFPTLIGLDKEHEKGVGAEDEGTFVAINAWSAGSLGGEGEAYTFLPVSALEGGQQKKTHRAAQTACQTEKGVRGGCVGGVLDVPKLLGMYPTLKMDFAESSTEETFGYLHGDRFILGRNVLSFAPCLVGMGGNESHHHHHHHPNLKVADSCVLEMYRLPTTKSTHEQEKSLKLLWSVNPGSDTQQLIEHGQQTIKYGFSDAQFSHPCMSDYLLVHTVQWTPLDPTTASTSASTTATTANSTTTTTTTTEDCNQTKLKQLYQHQQKQQHVQQHAQHHALVASHTLQHAQGDDDVTCLVVRRLADGGVYAPLYGGDKMQKQQQNDNGSRKSGGDVTNVQQLEVQHQNLSLRAKLKRRGSLGRGFKVMMTPSSNSVNPTPASTTLKADGDDSEDNPSIPKEKTTQPIPKIKVNVKRCFSPTPMSPGPLCSSSTSDLKPTVISTPSYTIDVSRRGLVIRKTLMTRHHLIVVCLGGFANPDHVDIMMQGNAAVGSAGGGGVGVAARSRFGGFGRNPRHPSGNQSHDDHHHHRHGGGGGRKSGGGSGGGEKVRPVVIVVYNLSTLGLVAEVVLNEMVVFGVGGNDSVCAELGCGDRYLWVWTEDNAVRNASSVVVHHGSSGHAGQVDPDIDHVSQSAPSTVPAAPTWVPTPTLVCFDLYERKVNCFSRPLMSTIMANLANGSGSGGLGGLGSGGGSGGSGMGLLNEERGLGKRGMWVLYKQPNVEEEEGDEREVEWKDRLGCAWVLRP